MRPLSFAVPKELEGAKVIYVLTEVFKMSHSHIARLKRRERGLTLSGEPCYVTARCKEGDIVSALISASISRVSAVAWSVRIKSVRVFFQRVAL